MNRFRDIANQKLNNMLKDETSILVKTKEKLKDSHVSIPVTSDMLMELLEKQDSQSDKISKISIIFKEDYIRVSGVTKKFLLEIPFELDLKPLKAEKRVLHFELRNMKPLNQDWIKSKVLNKPPLLSFVKGNIQLDLNQVEKIRAVPFGNIQHFEIREGKLWIKIGI